MTKLEKALAKSAVKECGPLCFTHVTIGKFLTRILTTKKLKPIHCETFNTKHLYFSYGLPAYRPHNRQTEDELDFPIAFIFSTELISEIYRFYPFDTGAMAKKVFGVTWRRSLPLDETYIADRPARLVSCFYSDNSNYIFGKVHQPCLSKTPPITTIHRFLSKDLSRRGADQRQRTIEAISTKSIDLLAHLQWVAYPVGRTAEFAKLWRQSPIKFKYHGYEHSINDNPAQLMTQIIASARKEFNFLYSEPK